MISTANGGKSMEKMLKPIMLDPSLLCKVEFWEGVADLKEIFSLIYFPRSIKFIEDLDFRDFYGGYLHKEKILSVDKVIAGCQEAFKSFYWREHYKEVPQYLADGFERFRRRLEESYLPRPIQQTLLDEFVFLSTQSSCLLYTSPSPRD